MSKSRVYFKKFPAGAGPEEFSALGSELLQTLLEKESVTLEKHLPLKVHFGEKGNRTYLPAKTYDGVIDLLQERGVVSEYTETSVLYGGERFSRAKHTALAAAHGFTRLPVVIADGEKGGDAVDVPVNLHHFRSCAVAQKLAEAPQILVCAHFKGHALAGFGGAIKQLSMGCAAKGGKMAMHLSVKPKIWNWRCVKCGQCQARCNQHAITLEGKSKIDPEKCIGCGACFSICPRHAVSIFNIKGFWNALFKGKFFREKLVEYAYAAHHGKRNLYLTFAASITRGCDCEPRPMHACIPDIGVFASLDPVAIDAACWDASARAGHAFKGREQLDYAEKIGLGSKDYELIELA